jgi:hypothetical protein
MADETKPDIGFLEEQAGEKSAMRLMCFICLVVAVALFIFASIACFMGNPGTTIATQAGMTLLIAAFGGKVGQKFGEK